MALVVAIERSRQRCCRAGNRIGHSNIACHRYGGEAANPILPREVTSTPGGSRIFTLVFQVITDIYDYKMPLQDALAAKRFHHQLPLANTIFWKLYMPIRGDLAKQLDAKGYVLAGLDFKAICG